MSARTSCSSSNICPANWSSSSIRRARWPSASGQGGAGIPAFYTRTGVGTIVADGKPQEEFDGELYVRETWLRADLAIIKAWRADTEGNLQFRKTARNFNPIMATAADGDGRRSRRDGRGRATIDPDCVHTPGIYVQRIVQSTINEKRIEKLTVQARANGGVAGDARRERCLAASLLGTPVRPRPSASRCSSRSICRTAIIGASCTSRS